jgi:hypothetical protein
MACHCTQRFTAWLCLAVYLMAGVFRAPGLVLCIKADGDMAIELPCDGSSCWEGQDERRALDATGNSDTKALATGCQCTDVPLLLGRDESPQHTPKGAGKAPAKQPCAWVPADLPPMPRHQDLIPQPCSGSVDPPWRIDALLRLQRRVVLLI